MCQRSVARGPNPIGRVIKNTQRSRPRDGAGDGMEGLKQRGMSWTSTAAAVQSEGQSDALLTPLKSHFIVQTMLSILILLLALSSPPWLYSTSSSMFLFICEYCFLISLHCHLLLIQWLPAPPAARDTEPQPACSWKVDHQMSPMPQCLQSVLFFFYGV